MRDVARFDGARVVVFVGASPWFTGLTFAVFAVVPHRTSDVVALDTRDRKRRVGAFAASGVADIIRAWVVVVAARRARDVRRRVDGGIIRCTVGGVGRVRGVCVGSASVCVCVSRSVGVVADSLTRWVRLVLKHQTERFARGQLHFLAALGNQICAAERARLYAIRPRAGGLDFGSDLATGERDAVDGFVTTLAAAGDDVQLQAVARCAVCLAAETHVKTEVIRTFFGAAARCQECQCEGRSVDPVAQRAHA